MSGKGFGSYASAGASDADVVAAEAGTDAKPKKKVKKKTRRKIKKRKGTAKTKGTSGSGEAASSTASATVLPSIRTATSPSASEPATKQLHALDLGSTAPAATASRQTQSAAALPGRRHTSAGARGGSVASASSSRKRGSRGLAGYVPPTSAADVEGATKERAAALVASTPSLRTALKDPLFLAAAEQVGVAVDELLPRKAETFRHTMGTPRSSLKERKRFHDENRMLNIAIVLSHQDAAEEEAAKLAERQRRMREATARDLLSRVEMERSRIEKAVMARERQRKAVERENRRLQRVREDYAHTIAKEKAMQEKRQQLLEERQREMVRKAQESAKTMAEVRKRREEVEAARLDGIRAAEEQKMARRDHLAAKQAADRKKTLLKAQAKDRLLEERKQASMSQMLHRRETMMRQLVEHEKAVRVKEIERDAEVQRIRDERWVAEARAKANSERLRRQQQARRAAKASLAMIGMEKQEMFGEVNAAIDKERRDIQKTRLLDEDLWKASTPLERGVTPGPGEYEFRKGASEAISTGRWRDPPLPEVRRMMETKSWVDQTPGPDHYGRPDDSLTRQKTAGSVKFHDANPKSFLDWAAHRGQQLPAPSDYGRPGLVEPQRSFGFSKHTAQGFLDHAAYLARDSPGPGGTMMSAQSPISPKAVIQAMDARPATTGSSGMRRTMSFAATPASGIGGRRRSVSPDRPSSTGGFVRTMSSVELRSSQGMQLVRRKSEKQMVSELSMASKMKGLGAAAKFNPSLSTISKQLEDLVEETSEMIQEADNDDALDEVDTELLAAADRTGQASS